MALGKSVKGRRENTKMRWNVKTAIIALLKRTLLFIFILHTSLYAIYGACSMEPKQSQIEVGREGKFESAQAPFSSAQIMAPIVVLHFNSGRYNVSRSSVFTGLPVSKSPNCQRTGDGEMELSAYVKNYMVRITLSTITVQSVKKEVKVSISLLHQE